jgi:plasminogen activator
MRRRVLILLGLVLAPVAARAGFQAAALAGPKEGGRVPFAAQAGLGVLNGEAQEHVYDYEGPGGRRRQLSRLDWDLKGIGMGGGSLSARVLPKLTLNGGLWLALTEGSGEMDDYDWLNVRSPDWTHYSLSEVDVTAGYLLDLNATWDLVAWNGFTARVRAGYKQDGWTWEDRGVYLLYPEYGYVPQDLGGANMINYEQQFRMPYLGASADWGAGSFTVSGYLTWSPVVAATDWDEHVARDLHFKETFEGGDMLGFGAEVRYDFAAGFFRGCFLAAALDYQRVDLIIGDMEVRNIVTGETGGDRDVAGIENEYRVISLGGGVRF